MTHLAGDAMRNSATEVSNIVNGLVQRPPLSRQQQRSWTGIAVEEYARPAGEGVYQLDRHRLFVSLSDQNRSVLDIDGKRVWEAPLQRHRLSFTPAGRKAWAFGPDAEALVIYHDPEVYRGIASGVLGRDDVELDMIIGADDPFLLNVALALRQEVQVAGLADKLLVESLSNTLAIGILRRMLSSAQPRAGSGDGLPAEALRLVVDYVQANLGNPGLALSDLAAVAGLSVFHFSRCFKRATGQTPHGYVIRRRIEQAKHLIRFSRMSLPEIALACGFSSQSHFTARFRTATGTTPTSYRRSAG